MRKIIAYLTAAAIIYDMLTPLSLFLGGGKALMMFLPTFLIVVYDRLFVKKNFWPMALYVGSGLFLMLVGSNYFTTPFLLQIVYAYSCIEHYMITRDRYFVKMVMAALYISLAVMITISLPLFITIPNLSRIMIDAEENGVTSPLFYWTLSYPVIHALPVYSIPVFYLFRNTKKKFLKIVALLFFAAIFALMLFADSTGALLVNVAVVGVLLLYNQKKSLKSNISRLTVLGVGISLLLNKAILVGILTFMQPVFTGSSTYVKIDEIIYMLEGGDAEGDMGSRGDQLAITWKSFLENPLFPTIENEAYTKIGGHNFLLDQIAVLGLILSVFFIWFLIDRIKRPIKHLNRTTRPYYLVGVLAMLVMGAMKNFFILYPTCFILPVSLMLIDNNINAKIH